MDASNYDPMAALDMEKRTGIKHADIDDFLERAKAVEQKIEDIRSGKISVEQLAAEQEAELKAKRDAEAAKIKRLAEIAEREKLRRAKEKAEERESWWRGALAPCTATATTSRATPSSAATPTSPPGRAAAQVRERLRPLERGPLDAEGPSGFEEEAAVEKEKTDKENAVFEKNNKEFCDNFMADMEGNRYFKAKKYDDALRLYRESLGVRPYEKTTLLNVAQVFLKMALWDDALERGARAREARAVDEAAALAEAAAGAPKLSDAEKTKRDSEELLAAFSKIAAKSGTAPRAARSSADLARSAASAAASARSSGRLGATERPDAGALEQAYDGGFDLGDGGMAPGDLGATRPAAAPAAPATGAAKALVLSTLAAAVRGEPKSKDLAVDGGALEEILTAPGRRRRRRRLRLRARAAAAATTSARARGGLLARLVTAAGHERARPRGRSGGARSALRRRRRRASKLSKLRGDAPAAEERDALVRAMAGALAADKDPDGAVRNFHAKGGYRVLAAILPRPRADLGAVTATSVSQPPVDGTRVSPSCACNAAKVLLAALSNDDAAPLGRPSPRTSDGARGHREARLLPRELQGDARAAQLRRVPREARPSTRTSRRASASSRGVEMITTLGNALRLEGARPKVSSYDISPK
ncbi:hypothetical protein SO694_00050284 [Aureococcus anophagefferens]|uniref:Uncharacterized protein n=1 Tax=Aureococcus anophagefferens TaxID=44056 RepID=A0ABR1FYL0_AURAN